MRGFRAVREPIWDELEQLCRRARRGGGLKVLAPQELLELAQGYRGLAHDLGRVRRDWLGRQLEARLDALAAECHSLLYASGRRGGGWQRFMAIVSAVPTALWGNRHGLLVGLAAFYLPMLVCGVLCALDPDMGPHLLGEVEARLMESMYAEAPRGRAPAEAAGMTGFYIFNNVGIAFRCFATGIVAGLGSLWFLVFNGVVLGATTGHLVSAGLGPHLFEFVAAHSAWELTAIALSGAAGLQMGMALIRTGGRTRLDSLRAKGPDLLAQVMLAAAMLTVAAGLEAWVSPSGLGWPIKAAIGVTGWLVVSGGLVALCLVGRRASK